MAIENIVNLANMHSICLACYRKKFPEAVQFQIISKDNPVVICCYCGQENQDGVFLTDDKTAETCLCRKVN